MTGIFRINAARRQALVWVAYAAVLICAPLVFGQDAALSLLSQMGTMIIFTLSYNMLLGQGGMLSFGHAVYAGLGGFTVAHALNLAARGAIWMPVTLAPLAGGLCGALFSVLFGYLATRRSGVTFSMITLGIAELVAACSLMFSGFFGGEAGVATNRVTGIALFGISYGPQIEVYYLIAFWLLVCTGAMYAFTQTPLGRILNAVRDNPERVEFIGYNAQTVRYLAMIFSGFFAGISGGLAAINFEIVQTENLGTLRSGAVLLFTFIGGTAFFVGPIIGAVTGVILTSVLSTFTKAWQLYLGVFFMAIVMYAPGGIAGIAMQITRVTLYGGLRRLGRDLLRAGICLLAAASGAVMMVEMLYQLTLESLHGSELVLFGWRLDAAAPTVWLLALVLLLTGWLGFVRSRRKFVVTCDAVKADALPSSERNTV